MDGRTAPRTDGQTDRQTDRWTHRDKDALVTGAHVVMVQSTPDMQMWMEFMAESFLFLDREVPLSGAIVVKPAADQMTDIMPSIVLCNLLLSLGHKMTFSSCMVNACGDAARLLKVIVTLSRPQQPVSHVGLDKIKRESRQFGGQHT